MGHKVVAIVQARMGSTRLPGKALLHLAGDPLVAHVARRVSASSKVNKIVFAVPDSAENDPLASYVSEKLGLTVYRGSEDDVLGRFALAVMAEDPDLVVRITADDPLKDPALVDKAVDIMLQDPEVVYVSNSLRVTYPEGLDVEVIRGWAILEAASEAKSAVDREHVTPFIWRQPHRYRVTQFLSSRDLSTWRWTLDTLDDFHFLSLVFANLTKSPSNYAFEDIVDMIEASPTLFELMPVAPRSVEKLELSESGRTTENG